MSIFKTIHVEKWVYYRWNAEGQRTKIIHFVYGKFPDDFYEGAD